MLLFLRALSLVLGPRAVFVLGCWVACSQFTDLVVFRPSSVASVDSPLPVPDSATVQQPKDPPVCLSACLHHRVLSSTINLPAFASCWLAQRCMRIQTQSILCDISTIRPPPSHIHCICTPLSSKQTVARCCPRCDRLRHRPCTSRSRCAPPFPRHRSCTLPNLAPCPHRPSHQPGSVLATLVCAAASGTSRLRRPR